MIKAIELYRYRQFKILEVLTFPLKTFNWDEGL